MPVYQLSENDNFDSSTINSNMFGTNFVTSFDFEFLTGSGAIDVLNEIGATVLRFPGGSVTEFEFTESVFSTGNLGSDTYVDANGNETTLTTIHDFVQSASAIGADIMLVIPTRVAFEKSAGQALFEGRYGDRKEISDDYFVRLNAYVEYTLDQAAGEGIEITRFEIGNEFWGSGQMTAGEYGFLAAEITEYLGLQYPDIEVVIQLLASANEYSPLASRTVYLEAIDDGDFIVHRTISVTTDGSEDWLQVTMPGQGNVPTQIDAISEQFNINAAANEALDGVVDHVYFGAGFDGIDNERDFALNFPFERFTSAINRSDLNYFVTEWSPRNIESTNDAVDLANVDNYGNANGLQLAHTTIESFFELTSNGVDGANFWPLTFGNPNIDGRVLIDTSELDLTFSGAAFKLMSESLVGLRPVLDFEVSGDIDIHGFSNETNSVFFVAERSGGASNGRQIDLSIDDFTPSQTYFANTTTLTSDDGTFNQVGSDQVVSFQNGYVESGNIVSIEMNPWEIVRVELQSITNQDDEIFGRDGNDSIEGRGGNDLMSGGAGSNHLDGGSGFDTASFDGNISQYEVSQSEANPEIWHVIRQDGAIDTLVNFEVLQFADQNLYLITVNDGGSFIVGTTGNDSLFGNVGDDIIEGGQGNDLLSGGAGRDKLSVVSGMNTLFGGEEKDLLIGGSNSDELYGGNGFDIIRGDASDVYGGSDRIVGGAGNDLLMGGNGRDTFVFSPNDGEDMIANFEIEDALYLNDQSHFQTSSGPDFQSGIDIIQLDGFETVNEQNVMEFVSAGSIGAVFSVEGTTIKFRGIEISDLHADDFSFA